MLKNKNFNIYVSEDDIVCNFTPISVHEIDNISNGSASNIVCVLLDKIAYNEKQNFIHILLNKLTRGGKLILKFIDFDIFKIKMYKGDIDKVSFNEMISTIDTLWTLEDLDKLVNALNGFNILEVFPEPDKGKAFLNVTIERFPNE